jgi:hypothetical protein
VRFHAQHGRADDASTVMTTLKNAPRQIAISGGIPLLKKECYAGCFAGKENRVIVPCQLRARNNPTSSYNLLLLAQSLDSPITIRILQIG